MSLINDHEERLVFGIIMTTIEYRKDNENLLILTGLMKNDDKSAKIYEIMTKLKSKLTRDSKEKNDEYACIICTDRKKLVVLLPCEHINHCVECAIASIGVDNTCPVCRGTVEDECPICLDNKKCVALITVSCM